MSMQPLPDTQWTDLLAAPPHFLSALWAGCSGHIADLAPLPRALLMFDIIDGQVGNGGVAQYFYNVLAKDERYEDAPQWIAEHPALAAVAPVVEEMHLRWRDKKIEVLAERARAARSDQGLRIAFALREKFEAVVASVEDRFFEHVRAQRTRCAQAILHDPHEHFRAALPQGLRGLGIEHAEVAAPEGRWRMRFVDGFPYGPNLLERLDGRVQSVRFSMDRMHVEFDSLQSGGDSEKRSWIDLRSGVGETRVFERGRLVHRYGLMHHWRTYGVNERYDDQGQVYDCVVIMPARGETPELHWKSGLPEHDIFAPRVVEVEVSPMHESPDADITDEADTASTAAPPPTAIGVPTFNDARLHRSYYDHGGLHREWIEHSDGGIEHLRNLTRDGRELTPAYRRPAHVDAALIKEAGEITAVLITHYREYCAALGIQGEINTQPRHDGTEHVYFDDGIYFIAVSERGLVEEQFSSRDPEAILYHLLESDTSALARAWEREHRVPGQDSRRLVFAKQVELLNQVHPGWALRCKEKLDEVLLRSPFVDRGV